MMIFAHVRLISVSHTCNYMFAAVVSQVQDPLWRQLLELCIREGSYRGCPCLDLGLTVRLCRFQLDLIFRTV